MPPRRSAPAPPRPAAGTGRHTPSAGAGVTVSATATSAPAGPNPYRPRASGTSSPGGVSMSVPSCASVAGSVTSTPASVPGACVTVTCRPWRWYVPACGRIGPAASTAIVNVSVAASTGAVYVSAGVSM